MFDNCFVVTPPDSRGWAEVMLQSEYRKGATLENLRQLYRVVEPAWDKIQVCGGTWRHDNIGELLSLVEQLGAKGLKLIGKLSHYEASYLGQWLPGPGRRVERLHLEEFAGRGWESMGNAGLSGMVEGIASSHSLKELTVHNSSLGKKVAEPFYQGLLKSGSIKKLTIDNCCLDYHGAKGVAEGLASNTTLKELRIRECSSVNGKMKNQGAIALASGIEKNTTLQRLSLERNRIGAQGAAALGKAVTHHPALKQFTFRRATLDSAAISSWVEGLEKNVSLKNLKFSQCKLDDAQGKALADVVEKIEHLKLGLRNNKLTEETSQAIKNQLGKRVSC